MRGSVVSISFTFPRALEDKEEQTLRDIIKKNQTQNIEKTQDHDTPQTIYQSDL